MNLKLFFYLILISVSNSSFAVVNEFWDFSNSQRWIGDTAEGNVEYCKAKSRRWTIPLLGFDINKDSTDDFLFAISCYQSDQINGQKHNIRVRAAWKMYCSNDQNHYDCTEDLFGSEVIEVTAVSSDAPIGSDGGGNPYFQVAEVPRDLNNDGYPEFWYAINRDDGRDGFDVNNDEDRSLLETFCGPRAESGEERWLWDCTRKSIQTMLISSSDGTYQIKELPWGVQNTQAILILPNMIGTFDVWAMIYGPHKVARYVDGDFVDVTTEYELDPNWQTVTTGGGPYAKAFQHEDSYYIARADLPQGERPSWASDVRNSGFMLWEYKPGQGFILSDVYTPNQDQTFYYKLQTGNDIETRFGAIIKDVPVFDPRWHFFDLEILDDSDEPVLIVQTESFTQLGDAFKSMPNPNLVYENGDYYAEQNTSNTIWGSANAVQGFYIRNGRLVERSTAVIESNGIYDVAFKRFVDINSDGYIDMVGVSGGTERPSIFLNNTKGTLEKQFLGDIFPDLSNDSSYWESSDGLNGYGVLLYPFYSEKKLDLLYWTSGYVWNIPSFLGEDYVFSPGDIVLSHAKTDITNLKTLSPKEQQTLLETCISNGWSKGKFQESCKLGILFPFDTDSDNDGIYDHLDVFRFDGSESLDTDGDGTGNNADTDDDNDTVLDGDDAFPLDSTESVDTDSDSTGNNADTDDDNDGVLDANDDLPLDPTNDSDDDGVANNIDKFPENTLYSKDSDNDGMPDAWETLYGLNPNDAADATSDIDNDGVSALDEFLAGTIPSGSIDIDGNEDYDALTDGLLLLRGMFGLDGSALVTGTIASDASYTESVDIESRIASLGDLADIDGNGDIDALTDGLLTLRYLFGLQGDTLINGVVAGDATRKTAEEIEAHLETLMPGL